MKFIYTDKAKEFIKRNNIKKLYIREDIERGMGCCGIGTIRLKISLNGDEKNLKSHISDFVITYYDPILDSLLRDNKEVEISVFGIGNKKIFYTKTEFSPLNS